MDSVASNQTGGQTEPPAMGYALFVIHILLAGFLLFCNTMTTAAVCLNPDLRTLTNMFVANLAIADLLMGLATIVQSFYFLPQTSRFYDENIRVCILFYYVWPFTSAFESQFCLMMIAVDRLLYIAYPLKHVVYVTNRSVAVSIACSWLAAVALGGVPVFWNSYSLNGGSECVSEVVMDTMYYWKILPWTMLGAITVAIICYIKIIVIAKRQRRRSRVEAEVQLRAVQTCHSNGAIAPKGMCERDSLSSGNRILLDQRKSASLPCVCNMNSANLYLQTPGHVRSVSVHNVCVTSTKIPGEKQLEHANQDAIDAKTNDTVGAVQAEGVCTTEQNGSCPGPSVSNVNDTFYPERNLCFSDSFSNPKRSRSQQRSQTGSAWFLDFIPERLRTRSRDSQLHELGVSNEHQWRRHGRKSVYLFFAVNVLFAVCWIPYLTALLLGTTFADATVRAFLFYLASCNSGVDFVIYAWKTKEFRRAYRRLIFCKCSVR